MRYLSAAVFFLWCGTLPAAEHPKWSELGKLFNQAKDSETVASFVKDQSLSEVTKGPTGMFSPDDRAYRLRYDENRISTIIIKVDEWPEDYGEKHWRPYSKKLPAGLSPKDKREQIVKKLGNPVKNRQNTWQHDGLHIWVHFDEEKKTVDELYISPQIIEAAIPND